MLRTLSRSLSLVLIATTGLAAVQEPLYTLKVDVPVVSVDVSVTDEAGRAVNDLRAEDFEILENDVPQRLEYFSPVSSPYNIFLLFDRSGSTEHEWPLMQRAVGALLATLRPQDHIAIGAFDAELEMESQWNSPPEKLVAALGELVRPKAIGGTAFYRSLETVVQRGFKNVDGRRAVVVLTDGRDSSNYLYFAKHNHVLEASQDGSFKGILKTLRGQHIPVYTIALNTDRNFDPNVTGADEYRNLQKIFPNSPIPNQYLAEVRMRMESMSDATGGQVLFPRKFEEIVALYQQIGQELGTSYSVGYISTDKRVDGSFRRIEVRARNERLKITQSRTGYYSR
jgi:VWFA-related protein